MMRKVKCDLQKLSHFGTKEEKNLILFLLHLFSSKEREMKKRINAYVYTEGKFGKRLRETLDCDNSYLYSGGRYPTKITSDDLPEDYIKIHSRVTWYMTGYLKTSGIVDMGYTSSPVKHMFKDDYIYISYKEKLRMEPNWLGLDGYVNDDVCVCGWDIPNIVLAAELYSNYDTTWVRDQIEKKRIWYRDKHSDDYKHELGFDEDIFSHYRDSEYIPEKLKGAYALMDKRKGKP